MTRRCCVFIVQSQADPGFNLWSVNKLFVQQESLYPIQGFRWHIHLMKFCSAFEIFCKKSSHPAFSFVCAAVKLKSAVFLPPFLALDRQHSIFNRLHIFLSKLTLCVCSNSMLLHDTLLRDQSMPQISILLVYDFL